MRKLLGSFMLSALVLMPAPAWADHDYGYDEGCGRGGAGCGNEREERYGDNSCKYVCPDFKDSPVQDAFNFAPQICLPGATCHFDGQRDEERQPPEGQPQN